MTIIHSSISDAITHIETTRCSVDWSIRSQFVTMYPSLSSISFYDNLDKTARELNYPEIKHSSPRGSKSHVTFEHIDVYFLDMLYYYETSADLVLSYIGSLQKEIHIWAAMLINPEAGKNIYIKMKDEVLYNMATLITDAEFSSIAIHGTE